MVWNGVVCNSQTAENQGFSLQKIHISKQSFWNKLLLILYDYPFFKTEKDRFIVANIFVDDHAGANGVVVSDLCTWYGGGIGADHIVVSNLSIARQGHFGADKVVIAHHRIVADGAAGVEHIEIADAHLGANRGIVRDHDPFPDGGGRGDQGRRVDQSGKLPALRPEAFDDAPAVFEVGNAHDVGAVGSYLVIFNAAQKGFLVTVMSIGFWVVVDQAYDLDRLVRPGLVVVVDVVPYFGGVAAGADDDD